MAKKTTTSTTPTTKAASTKKAAKSSDVISTGRAPAGVANKTAVRNTGAPRAASITRIVEPKEISWETIAKRAFEIHASGFGGSQDDNWFRAERELRSGR
jgi:hypothetical protein